MRYAHYTASWDTTMRRDREAAPWDKVLRQDHGIGRQDYQTTSTDEIKSQYHETRPSDATISRSWDKVIGRDHYSEDNETRSWKKKIIGWSWDKTIETGQTIRQPHETRWSSEATRQDHETTQRDKILRRYNETTERDKTMIPDPVSVSYTHLTLPTIYPV